MFDNGVAKEKCPTFLAYEKTAACTESAQERKEERSWLSKIHVHTYAYVSLQILRYVQVSAKNDRLPWSNFHQNMLKASLIHVLYANSHVSREQVSKAGRSFNNADQQKGS